MFSVLRRVFSSSTRQVKFPADAAIVFVVNVDAACRISPDKTFETDQASMRLRVGIPARELARRRPVWLIPLDYFERDPKLASLGRVGAVIIGKLPVSFLAHEQQRAARLLAWADVMARECRAIVDFADDLAAAADMYSLPVLAETQKRLLATHSVTVPNEALRNRLARDAKHDVSVIEDPYEAELAGIPRLEPGEVLRLAWFGVFGPPLRLFIEAEFAKIARRLVGRRVQLDFVTYSHQADLVLELGCALQAINEDFVVRHVAWSFPAATAALKAVDLVVLPQDAQSDWGRVKSHNRLVESLRAGRFCVASPIPSYLELKQYAWVDSNLAEGIVWAVEHPREVRERITSGQQHIVERFAPAVIGAKWAQLLGVDPENSS